MRNIAVIYKSKYGATKQYAEWIAAAVNATLWEASTVKPAQWASFDAVIYGGALYAGKIAGAELIAEKSCSPLAVFTVGLANPKTKDYSAILNQNFTQEFLAKTMVFHLRGSIDYGKLGFVHRGMMAMVKNFLSRKNETKLSDEDKVLLNTYGGSCSFIKKSDIEPILAFVKRSV